MRLPYPFRTLLALTLALAVVFTSASMRMNGGELVPPLDDAFIHFQYARRLAEGAPFSYQPGEGYSSGATSLLWPVVLAVGWLAGFKGESLYIWSILVSVTLLAAAGAFTYRWVARVADEPTAVFAALLLVTSGPLLWAAHSGMEIVLYVAAMAAVLERVSRPDGIVPTAGALGWVAVLAAVRPEGALLAGALALVQIGNAWLAGGRGARAIVPALPWLLPVTLGAIQPVLNYVNTGLVASSSALAKQNPRMHPVEGTGFVDFVWSTAIWEGYGQHFFGGAGTVVLVLFGVGAWTLLLRERARGAGGVAAVGLAWWAIPLMFLAIFLPLSLNQFRYLQPYLVVVVPFMAVGAAEVDAAIARSRGQARAPFVLGTLAVALAFAGVGWSQRLAENARDILSQQVDVSRWVARALPADAVVAGNDVGALAYIGERRLVDLEGIISLALLPDALEGEGSTYEALRRVRPDVVVAFPGWFPGTFNAEALVIRRHARVVRRTISGGPDLVVATLAEDVLASGDRPPELGEGERVLDTLNISDRMDEAAHAAWFADTGYGRGKANTVVAGAYADGSRVVDSARRLEGAASFVVARGAGTRLVGRFGPSEARARLEVRVDGAPVGLWEVPAAAADTWHDAAIALPGSGPAHVDIVPVEVGRVPGGGWHLARVWTVGR